MSYNIHHCKGMDKYKTRTNRYIILKVNPEVVDFKKWTACKQEWNIDIMQC